MGRVLLIVGVGPVISTLLMLLLLVALSSPKGFSDLFNPDTQFYAVAILGLYWIVCTGSAVFGSATWFAAGFHRKHRYEGTIAAAIIGGLASLVGASICFLLLFRGSVLPSPALLFATAVFGAVAFVVTAVPGRR